jgi:uncharacterized protein with GYD domain
MPTFAMLTRVSPGAAGTPMSLPHLEHRVMEHVQRDCPGVRWQKSWAVLGGYDYLDVFDAPDVDTALKVAVIVRSYGCASTELWPIVEWTRFKQLLEQVKCAESA